MKRSKKIFLNSNLEKNYNKSKPKCPIKTLEKKAQDQSSLTTQDGFLNQQI